MKLDLLATEKPPPFQEKKLQVAKANSADPNETIRRSKCGYQEDGQLPTSPKQKAICFCEREIENPTLASPVFGGSYCGGLKHQVIHMRERHNRDT